MSVALAAKELRVSSPAVEAMIHELRTVARSDWAGPLPSMGALAQASTPLLRSILSRHVRPQPRTMTRFGSHVTISGKMVMNPVNNTMIRKKGAAARAITPSGAGSPKTPTVSKSASGPALKTAAQSVASARPKPVGAQPSGPLGAKATPVTASKSLAGRRVGEPEVSVRELVVSRIAPRTVAELKVAFASMIDRRVARYANVMATLGPSD